MPRPSPQTDRVVGVIELLGSDAAADGGATMTEIARHLGVDQATCVHLLAALATAGFVVREPDRRYHLGPALVHPGRVAGERYALLAAARPEMAALSAELAMPCFAFAPDGDHARLAQVTWPPGPDTDRRQVRVGETVPMVPPLGLLFVAWGADDGFAEWLARGPSDPASVGRAHDARRHALDLGYVVELAPDFAEPTELTDVLDDRESPFRDGRLHRLLSAQDGAQHVASIGAPVFGSTGDAVLSITLVTYWSPMTPEAVAATGEAVRSAAARVTAATGGVASS